MPWLQLEEKIPTQQLAAPRVFDDLPTLGPIRQILRNTFSELVLEKSCSVLPQVDPIW